MATSLAPPPLSVSLLTFLSVTFPLFTLMAFYCFTLSPFSPSLVNKHLSLFFKSIFLEMSQPTRDSDNISHCGQPTPFLFLPRHESMTLPSKAEPRDMTQLVSLGSSERK